MLKTVIFNIEFTLSFSKPSYNKLEILLILNFDLSEKIGKAVTNSVGFRSFFQLNCSNFKLKL